MDGGIAEHLGGADRPKTGPASRDGFVKRKGDNMTGVSAICYFSLSGHAPLVGGMFHRVKKTTTVAVRTPLVTALAHVQ
jgi:hypothetical protein